MMIRKITILGLLFAFLLVAGCANETVQVTEDEARQISEQRVKQDYNFKQYNGSNLRLVNIDKSGESYRVTYRYDVAGGPANVDEIEASVVVTGEGAGNYSHKEISEINSFNECVAAGYEKLEPDCVGCQVYCETPDGKRFEKPAMPKKPTKEPQKYFVEYVGGSLNYNLTVQKPTPCHEVTLDSQVMESYPTQVRLVVQIRDTGKMCAQVIDTEQVTGSLELGDRPGSVSVIVDGEEVYSKTTRCEDKCGDGNCDEIVCQAIGCPCPETPSSCPEDCG